MVLGYDEDDGIKLWAYEVFCDRLLPHMLWCIECGEHAESYIEDNTVNLESREGFAEWVLDFHNAVNDRVGKDKWSVEQYISHLDKLALE